MKKNNERRDYQIIAKDWQDEVTREISLNGRSLLVDQMGNVFRPKRYKPNQWELAVRPNKVNGRNMIYLNGTSYYVSRVVYETFKGHYDYLNLDVDHIDNNCSNDHLENLRAIPIKENCQKEILRRVDVSYRFNQNYVHISAEEAMKAIGHSGTKGQFLWFIRRLIACQPVKRQSELRKRLADARIEVIVNFE